MAVETAINSSLKYDSATRKALGEMNGQALEINCTLPPPSFYVIFGADGVSLLSHYEGTANTSLRGNRPVTRCTGDKRRGQSVLYGTGVEVEGDHDLLRQIRRILKYLDVDWRPHWRNLIGDVPAQSGGRVPAQCGVMADTNSQTRRQCRPAEFAQEETCD